MTTHAPKLHEPSARAAHPPLVVFSHGKESGPWGRKIEVLAEVARQLGWAVLSVDYRDLDDPEQRVTRLLSTELPPHDALVLVGSSMGGYVATVASATLQPAGLFLMVPAVFRPDYAQQHPTPHAGRCSVVWGWDDDIIPVADGIRFAQAHRAALHVLAADHRLDTVIPELAALFHRFLNELRTNIAAA